MRNYSIYKKKNYIDELIIETENIGKVNSILKALRTADERLITITDGDVLFLNDWEKEILKIFNAFPRAGMVSPVPVFRTHLRLTSNIWLKYLLSSKLKFRKVKNTEAMTKFANSIGWPWLDKKFKDVILTLKAKDNTVAVVGNSHFVGTYKKEVFDKLPKKNSNYKLGGNSETEYLDIPVLKYGAFRLATYNNYAYHLGNTMEPWMEKELKDIKDESKEINNFKYLTILKQSPFNYFVTEKLFKKIFKIKLFKKWIFSRKGLNNEQVNNFIN